MIPLMVNVGTMRINAAWVVTESIVEHEGHKYLVLTMGFPVTVATSSPLAMREPSPAIQGPFQLSIPEKQIGEYRIGFERARAELLDACAGVAIDEELEPDDPPDVSSNGKPHRD